MIRLAMLGHLCIECVALQQRQKLISNLWAHIDQLHQVHLQYQQIVEIQ